MFEKVKYEMMILLNEEFNDSELKTWAFKYAKELQNLGGSEISVTSAEGVEKNGSDEDVGVGEKTKKTDMAVENKSTSNTPIRNGNDSDDNSKHTSKAEKKNLAKTVMPKIAKVLPTLL